MRGRAKLSEYSDFKAALLCMVQQGLAEVAMLRDECLELRGCVQGMVGICFETFIHIRRPAHNSSAAALSTYLTPHNECTQKCGPA